VSHDDTWVGTDWTLGNFLRITRCKILPDVSTCRYSLNLRTQTPSIPVFRIPVYFPPLGYIQWEWRIRSHTPDGHLQANWGSPNELSFLWIITRTVTAPFFSHDLVSTETSYAWNDVGTIGHAEPNYIAGPCGVRGVLVPAFIRRKMSVALVFVKAVTKLRDEESVQEMTCKEGINVIGHWRLSKTRVVP
jgi:hypothetical protein